MRDRIAIVVFENRPAAGWCRFLSTGFRHCFAIVRVRSRWLVVDPLKSKLALEILPQASTADLLAHLGAVSSRVLIGCVPEMGPLFWSIRPLTCVELVKLVLCVRAPFVLTPRQLYRHLQQRNQFKPGATALDSIEN